MGTRLGAYGGLALVVTLVVAFILDMTLIATTGGPPQVYAATIGSDLSRAGASTIWPIELWVYVAAMVPFVVFLPGLAAALRVHSERLVEAGTFAGAAFIVFHTIHNMAYLAVVGGLAPAYAAGSPSAAATEQTARGLVAFAETAFLPGGGIGGALQIVMLIAFGIAQRHAGQRAAAWLAFASAGLATLGFARIAVPDAPVLPLVLGGWVAFVVWAGVSAVRLLDSEPIPAAIHGGATAAT